MSVLETVTEEFKRVYGESPALIVRAPGRVNLIGEHTDYNDGFVFPMAIDRAIYIALRRRTDAQVSVKSLDFDDPIEFDLNQLEKGPTSPAEYVKGMAYMLQQAGYSLKGWEGVLAGDVPVGAGLSSSAALEMATACTFGAVSGFEWDAPKMAKLGQKNENEWIGVSSGIMDQMISASGKKGHALLIDCRSLETQLVPLPPNTVVVILDTSTRRGLAGSAYNERHNQCTTAAKFFGVPALRDVTIEQFEARVHELEDVIRRRAKHVITENARVLKARDAMLAKDATALGQFMNASHESMRDDFEISGDALNAIVECAQTQDSCYGARMTGGGFAGCAVALVQADAAQVFADSVTACYTAKTGLTPSIYITPATDGAQVVFPANG